MVCVQFDYLVVSQSEWCFILYLMNPSIRVHVHVQFNIIRLCLFVEE